MMQSWHVHRWFDLPPGLGGAPPWRTKTILRMLEDFDGTLARIKSGFAPAIAPDTTTLIAAADGSIYPPLPENSRIGETAVPWNQRASCRSELRPWMSRLCRRRFSPRP